MYEYAYSKKFFKKTLNLSRGDERHDNIKRFVRKTSMDFGDLKELNFGLFLKKNI